MGYFDLIRYSIKKYPKRHLFALPTDAQSETGGSDYGNREIGNKTLLKPQKPIIMTNKPRKFSVSLKMKKILLN